MKENNLPKETSKKGTTGNFRKLCNAQLRFLGSNNLQPEIHSMRLTERAHHYLSEQLKPGEQAIDATAGNGHDTAHMASLVGPEGIVTAIDIQKVAVDATRGRLKAQGCLEQVQLLTGEHSEILQSLCSLNAQTISAIIFNLGYLPGSDKRIQTNSETTLLALSTSQRLLKPNGLLLVTAYRGHEGGQAEADSVAEWMQQIENRDWSVECHNPEARENKIPPILFVVRALNRYCNYLGLVALFT